MTKQQLAKAIKYWDYVAPVVKYPKNKKEFDELNAELDELLDIVGDDENHRLIGLVDIIGNLITTYEQGNFPIPAKKGINALKFLMEAHHLRQSDLSEIGTQGTVSEILRGKRKLNLRQMTLLAKRFHVDVTTFIDD